MKKYLFLFSIISIFLFTSSASAAITSGPGTGSGVKTNSFTFTVDVPSGSNPILFLSLGSEAAITSATYNGVAMTKLWSQVDGAGAVFSSAFILVNPPIGNYTLSVTCASSCGGIVTAWAQPWYGVSQAGGEGGSWRTPTLGNDGDSGSATASRIASNSISGDMVLDVMADYARIPTVNGSQSLQRQDNGPDGTGLYWGTSNKSATGSTAMSWTMTSTFWSIGVVPLIPAATGLDTAPPTVSITTPTNGAFASSTTFAVTASASDDIGVIGVQFLLDGANLGAEDTSSPFSVIWNTTTASNGPHTLSAIARDAVGNTATATLVNVTVDNQVPTGSISINGGASATKSTAVTLNLSATDNSGTVSQMRFSNTGTSFNAPIAYAPTASWTITTGAGTKTVYAQFKDTAGNWSPSFTDTIVLDTTAPTISAVTSSNITNNSATITWTTNEPATSQVNYGLTNAYGITTTIDTTLVIPHSVIVTGLNSQTLYNYRVRSKDAAGNERVGTNNSFQTLASPPDSIPPSVPENLTSTPMSASQINLSWDASVDNVLVTGYKVFRNYNQIANVTSGTSYSDINLLPETSYTYTVVAYDALNNTSLQSASSSTTTLPYTTSPSVSISSPTNGSTVSGTISLVANANDSVGVAGVTFQVDGVTIGSEDTNPPYSTNLDTNTLTNDFHVIVAVARDSSNNTATSSQIAVFVDNISPPSNMIYRYVNTASTPGGDGTTNNITGPNRAFATLRAALDSLPSVLTSPVTIYCDGAGGPDTGDTNQQPFDMVTTTQNYILITTNAANRAKMPHDPARYTLAMTNRAGLYNNIPSHIRFDGLQVQLTITNGSSYTAVKTTNQNETALDIDTRISDMIVHCITSPGSNSVGFVTSWPTGSGKTYVWNNAAYGCRTGFNSTENNAWFVNNTSYDNEFGFMGDATGQGMIVINNLATKGPRTSSYGFIGSFNSLSDYNAEDDGNGVPGTHSHSGTTFTFLNPGTSDIRLSPLDTGARNLGTNDPLLGLFSDDLKGVLRNGIWDIGADEAQ